MPMPVALAAFRFMAPRLVALICRPGMMSVALLRD
jgi:hypothetical protein